MVARWEQKSDANFGRTEERERQLMDQSLMPDQALKDPQDRDLRRTKIPVFWLRLASSPTSMQIKINRWRVTVTKAIPMQGRSTHQRLLVVITVRMPIRRIHSHEDRDPGRD